MKDLSKEDQERIEKDAFVYQDQGAFIDGAKYEHPIAKKEGFNEAIKEVNKLDGLIINGYLVTMIMPISGEEVPCEVFMDESLADRYIKGNPYCSKTEIPVIFKPYHQGAVLIV